jgi:acetylornithine/N-succinyldiaminopimelate aminotransferase
MLLPVYSRPDIIIDRGEGCYLWDTAGRRYLDFITGVGVNALGHAHPRITQAIARQAARCIHTSNYYHHAYQAPLVERLVEWSGLSRVFLSNSGTEAVEAALKAARAYGTRMNPGKYKLVALENSFHGRTLGSLSVTGQPHYRRPFGPLLPGVTFVDANSIDQLRAAVDDETAAIVLETVLGEGGIHVLNEEYLHEVRRLADCHDALWIADETQCGLGRTGTRFAFQHFPGLQPDIVATAKPLAAGIPLGATLFSAKAAAQLELGHHGTTFGGGPLACCVALQVLDLIDELLPNIRETGAYLQAQLCRLRETYPIITEVRGLGLMAGLQLAESGDAHVHRAMKRGLLINCTHKTVLRLLPPFIAARAEVDEALAVLCQTIEETMSVRPCLSAASIP